MLTIWIIHREPHHRNALARLAAAGDGAVIGGPADDVFATAPAPDAVVLGLAGDFEQELDFVHRFGGPLADRAWLLLSAPGEEAQARQLFDTLQAQHLSYPSTPTRLRRALRDATRQRRADPLSSRRDRDELRERFGRWFGDLERPEWIRALDPGLASVPVLIRGEEGTGRSLLARYLHAFGASDGGAFLQLSSQDVLLPEELAARLGAAAEATGAGPVSVWIDAVDRLPVPVQHALRDWIEFGPPPGPLRGRTVRWMAGGGDPMELDIEPGLDPRLAETLSLLDLHIPALREQTESIERFVRESTLAWCSARGEAVRAFSPEALALLEGYPWPGNLHELEALVLRTLAASAADPLLPVDLHFSAHEPARELREPWPAAGTEEDAQAASPDIFSFFEDPGLPAASAAIDPVRMATEAAENTLASPGETKPNSGEGSSLRRLVQAVAHAVRNPLVSIRTFSELLPENYDDPEFRNRFRELVGQDVARIDAAITRLQGMVDLPDIRPQPVDLAHLLDKLLDEHAEQIRARRLLILKELDHGLPHAYGDPMLLRDVFAGLLDRALRTVKDRGDLYIASKHHESGRAGEPSVRILLRYSEAGAPEPAKTDPALPGDENLEEILAQTIIGSLGGSFTRDTTDADECVVVIDLPAPGPE